MDLAGLLNEISRWTTPAIVATAVAHLFLFAFLVRWARRDLRLIASALDDFTRGLPHRSVLDRTSHLSDQIEAFLADVNEVLANPARQTERGELLRRMSILDEKRRYLHSMFFETTYNACRTMIEAYPLMGVLGTIVAIGAALRTTAERESGAVVGEVVKRFGDSIWATFAGLFFAILLMLINSVLEPRFTRLVEHRVHVREMIAKAKRELALASGEPR